MTRIRVALMLLGLVAFACGREAPKDKEQATQPPPPPVATPFEAAEAPIRAVLAHGRIDMLSRPEIGSSAEAVARFYDRRGWKLAWSRNEKPTAQAVDVVGFLASAPEHGLIGEDYDAARWPERLTSLGSGTPDEDARADVALTVSLMRIVSDLHAGRVNPRDVEFDLDVAAKRYDLADFVAKLVGSGEVRSTLESIEPSFAGYHRLEAALAEYKALAADHEDVVVSEIKVVEVGDEYPDTPKLVRLLRTLGDLPASVAVDESSTKYDGPLVDAMKHFQARHGVDADGRIGPRTFRALNTPLSWRVRQIELTLERWRWAPAGFERPPIVVNIPEYSLRAFDGTGKPALDMRIIAGKAARTPTPVLAGEIQQVIFQPYWYVPYSILKSEVLPELSDAYLAEHDMEIVDLSGRLQPLDDSSIAGLRGGALRVRQRPGLKNSLGPVKFDFASQQSIYLHGTPAQALFVRSRRDFSHGCIRVEDPEALAAWLLRDEPEWTRERIHKALEGQGWQRVKLGELTPVLIVYGTAVVMEDGEVRFFDDVYGHDKVLDAALKRIESRESAVASAQTAAPAGAPGAM